MFCRWQMFTDRKWKVFRCIFCAAVITIPVVMWRRQDNYSEYLRRSMQGPLKPDDPELLRYLRNEILVPPSQEPYILNKTINAVVMPNYSEVYYRNLTETLFKNKTNGFFVEAGAFDGELMSNTLWLETSRGWTGLLVEPDKASYKALLRKNRKAWSANVCLAVNPYPTVEMMISLENVRPWGGKRSKAMNRIVSVSEVPSLDTFAKVSPYHPRQFVNCIPLESLLLALDVRRVDLLSLDVEGGERQVLSHLDLDRFDVQVIFLEWLSSRNSTEVLLEMKRRGYIAYSIVPGDMVLVKNGSEYHRELIKNRPSPPNEVYIIKTEGVNADYFVR